jgi:NAD+ diphosphatase
MNKTENEWDNGIFFIFDASSEGRVLLRGDELIRNGDNYGDIVRENGSVLFACDGQSEPDTWSLWAGVMPIPEGHRFVSRRDIAGLFGFDIFTRSGMAFQMMSLRINNKFCGKCGGAMRDNEAERARECPACGRIVYPALSPAIIVAVEKEGKLLMGHNVGFPKGRYSIIAGFASPGETLEQAVEREVLEESGIKIKNIKYFGSQPWPFPASMMLGFRAEWESGEPSPDGEELEDVCWFGRDELPDIPPNISISRKLIDNWLRS